MNKIILHVLGYTLVAGCSFWSGALTRDYLVTKEGRAEKARYVKFLNRPAPALASRTMDMAPWELSQHRGKVVVIDAWATWCGPCIAALPEIQRLQERFGSRSDFALVGVSLDKQIETVRRFCAERGMTWTQLIEPGKEFDSSIARALDVRAIPFTCIIDKAGIVRTYRHTSDLERVVERLLAEPDPSVAATRGT